MERRNLPKETAMNRFTPGVFRLLSAVALLSTLAPLALAQQFPAACGPGNVGYSVKLNKNPPAPAPPPPGKALVYFIHDGWDGVLFAYPTTLMGLDGAWVGANHGDSYFSVPVDPGEHHVCATLQTSIMYSRVELAHFTAEAGKTYFFRTRLLLSRSIEILQLEPLDSDQGIYLSGSYRLSVSKPKNNAPKK
jgi:hypothetical protein